MSKTFSAADVACHNKAKDLYIIVDEDVYDLTTFQDEHPGESQCSHCFRVFELTKAAGGKKSKRSASSGDCQLAKASISRAV